MFVRVSLRHNIIAENKRWMNITFYLPNSITSWACLLTSGWILIFHWKVLLLIFLRSSFSSLADTFTSWVTENKDVSSANSLTLDDKLSGRPLIQIRNNNGPKVDPCGTPAFTLPQAETWPLSTTLCFLLLKKLKRMFNRSPKMPFCSSLKITPLCLTLSKALDISKKTLLP